MSTSYNAYIIYGFLSDSPVSRDRKTGEALYLGDWLANDYPSLEQHNAGRSNGGSPKFFVGVVVVRLVDFTRLLRPWSEVRADLMPAPDICNEVERAWQALRAIDPDLVSDAAPIGLYLIGDAA